MKSFQFKRIIIIIIAMLSLLSNEVSINFIDNIIILPINQM